VVQGNIEKEVGDSNNNSSYYVQTKRNTVIQKRKNAITNANDIDKL